MSKRISVTVGEDRLDWLNEEADAQNISKGQLIRDLIDSARGESETPGLDGIRDELKALDARVHQLEARRGDRAHQLEARSGDRTHQPEARREAETHRSGVESEEDTHHGDVNLRQRIRELDFPEFRLEDDRVDVLVEIVETLEARSAMTKDEVLEIIENAEMQSVSSVQSFYDHGASRLGGLDEVEKPTRGQHLWRYVG